MKPYMKKRDAGTVTSLINDGRSILAWAEVSFIVHATEREELITSMFHERLGIPIERFHVRQYEGHYGNPIALFKARIDRADADRFAILLFSLLGDEARNQFLPDLARHLDDKGVLYLRIDRGSFAVGKVAIGEESPIRIRMKAAKRHRSGEPLDGYLSLTGN